MRVCRIAGNVSVFRLPGRVAVEGAVRVRFLDCHCSSSSVLVPAESNVSSRHQHAEVKLSRRRRRRQEQDEEHMAGHRIQLPLPIII